MEAEAVLVGPTVNQEKVELEVMVKMGADGMLTDDYYLHLSIRNIIDDEISNRYGDRTYTVTRGADAPGPQGPPGIPPATYLSGGEGGKQGSSQIRVIKSDLTEATFPKRYMLKVGFLPGRMSQMAQTVILAL